MSSETQELVRMREMVAGGQVRALREAAGLSRAEVGRACGVTGSACGYWERGHGPRGEPAVRYARLLFELESLARR